MSIPKIIHYCWFGGNELPKTAKKCIKSWKKVCPEYSIIEWNENNFDLSSCPDYVIQAYNYKKWAFVTDYVRLKVVYDHGGIYMDTDVELKKKPDFLLNYDGYFGFERGNIATGLGFGAVKGLDILRQMMDDYNELSFIKDNGEYNLVPCPKINTSVFVANGLIPDNSKQIICNNIIILPEEYLNPLEYGTHRLTLTKNTISIHWCTATWHTKKQNIERLRRRKKLRKIERRENITLFIKRTSRKILGNKFYDYLKSKNNFRLHKR